MPVLPAALFGFPGPQRDRLVAAVLCGAKTATTSLLEEHRRRGEALPRAGDRARVLDSAGREVAVIETTAVEVVPMRDVGPSFAHDEGEGFATARAWREAHLRFFSSPEMAAALGPPPFPIDDGSLVVCERFRRVFPSSDPGVAREGAAGGLGAGTVPTPGRSTGAARGRRPPRPPLRARPPRS